MSTFDAVQVDGGPPPVPQAVRKKPGRKRGAARRVQSEAWEQAIVEREQAACLSALADKAESMLVGAPNKTWESTLAVEVSRLRSQAGEHDDAQERLAEQALQELRKRRER